MTKKTLILFVGFIFTLGLSACAKEEVLEITPDTLITMENLDLYMYRDDVQYVDLRNWESSFHTGFIDGFERIPFFDFLDYRAFVRGRTYEFDPDQLVDEALLARLFKPEKAIFLYADGCIRSGYLKDALNYLGYERVYVIGGFYEYEGAYAVEGDGRYSHGDSYYNTYTNETLGITYIISGTLDVGRNITEIRMEMIDGKGDTMRGVGYYDTTDYNGMLTIVETYINGSIHNFNELYEELMTPDSEIQVLEDVDWDTLSDFIILIEKEYIN